MIRAFLPSDVLDIALQGRALSNKARTKDNLTTGIAFFGGLASLLGQWFSPRGRFCVWVCTEGFSLRGLSSVRDRSSPQAWEVDRLLLREQDGDCCLALLEQVSLAGGELAVEKVFHRPVAPAVACRGRPVQAAPGAQGAGAPGGAMAGMGAPGQPLPPQVLSGMLQAARQMLFQGQYQEAISAYQAVLKREPNNVDAMTHLALIVAIGGHADSALETWDKALKLDPKYAPAYLYRGQVLYETKQDYAGAIKAWERFVALVPSGQDHDRAQALIKDARTKQSRR